MEVPRLTERVSANTTPLNPHICCSRTGTLGRGRCRCPCCTGHYTRRHTAQPCTQPAGSRRLAPRLAPCTRLAPSYTTDLVCTGQWEGTLGILHGQCAPRRNTASWSRTARTGKYRDSDMIVISGLDVWTVLDTARAARTACAARTHRSNSPIPLRVSRVTPVTEIPLTHLNYSVPNIARIIGHSPCAALLRI